LPLLNEGTRYLIDTLKSRINEVVFGFDGTIATQEDGGIGNPATVVTPNIRVVDDNTLIVEAKLALDTSFTRPLREVVIRYKNPSDSTDTTDFMRYTYNSIQKNNNNEIVFSAVIEVTA
jgi:hypothetical protein|tara:strand:- start:1182 stop:1538 length:357 start_codon:yes stop_codon:yes gene_type:complete